MIEKLTDNISILFNEEGFINANTVLIEGDSRIMIDSGSGNLLKQIEPEHVDVLLMSHSHYDHINGNDLFTGAVKYAHPIERESLKNPEKTTATEGWDRLMGDDVENYAEQLGGLNPRVLEPWPVDRVFDDGDIFENSSTKIEVILTPGHTAGHCAFFFPEENFIFTGDICLTKVGPWYGDFDCDVNDFIASVNRIIEMKPAKLTTAHNSEILTENITETLQEYRDRIYKREKRILNFIKKGPATIDSIAGEKLIYRMHPTAFVLFWEKAMVKQHILRLLEGGLIRETEEGVYTGR